MVKLDSRNFSRVVFFGILTTILLGVFYYIFFGVTELHLSGNDFVSYLTGGQILKKGEGELIYNIKSQTAHQKDIIGVYAREVALPFKALPFVGLFFIPLTLFPVLVGYRLFAILNFFLLLGFTLYSRRIFKRIKTYSFWFLIPFVFLSSVSVIIQGQISFFLSFLVLLLFLSIKTKRGHFSGILSGLLLIKPQYIIALPFFFVLAKDKRRFLYGFGLSFILLLFLSIYLSGF
ncbi:MAG: glycosyltransferase family 87 protein, partial [Patescibacteria group bacterium]